MIEQDEKSKRKLNDYLKNGEHFDAGCTEAQIEQYLNICNEIDSFKLACVVKHWEWWDLDVLEDTKKTLYKKLGQYASMIKADYVILDQTQRLEKGNRVRTSLLYNFHENCIFETKNSFYVLVGKGTRKTVSPSLVLPIF